MTRLLLGSLLMLIAAPASDDFARFGKFGDAGWARGEFTQAAEWYERAAGLEPDAPEPLYNLALTYYRSGSHDLCLRYLDKAQALSHGALRDRCLLLRADLEFRDAMKQSPARRVEGLERALALYRAAGPSEIAKYNIEVVKLLLPPARNQAPQVSSSDESEDPSADDTAEAGKLQSPGNKSDQKREDRDW